MFAPRLALVCLIAVVPSPAQDNATHQRVTVALVSSLPEDSQVFRSFKSSLDAVMREAGVHVAIRTSPDPVEGEVVVVKLRGSCETPRQNSVRRTLEDLASLASTASSNGEILPFTSVDCEALDRFIGDAVAKLPNPERATVYGRAMARLAAHELYHVLSAQAGHRHHGLAEASLSRRELMSNDPVGLEIVLAHQKPVVPSAVPTDIVGRQELILIYEGK